MMPNTLVRVHQAVLGALLGCLGAVPVLLSPLALAVPAAFPYVGLLTATGGAPYGGSVNATFTLHHSADGDTSFWTYSYIAKTVTDGILVAVIGGEGSPTVDAADLSAPEVWLEIAVNGVILTPRQQVLSVPYARLAEDAESLGGLDASSYALAADLAAVAADVATLAGGGSGGGGGAGLTWSATSTDVNAAAGHGYVTTSTGAAVSVALPATCAIGDQLRVVGRGSAGFVVALPPGDTVLFEGEALQQNLASQIASASIELVCVDALGVWNATSAAFMGKECKTIARASCAAHLSFGCEDDGLYFVDPDGSGATFSPTAVWCDMSQNGGGWTLVMRVGTTAPGAGWNSRSAYGVPAEPAPSGATGWKYSDDFINAVRGATGTYRVATDTFSSSLYFKAGEYDHTRPDLAHLYQAWTSPSFSGGTCSSYYYVHFGFNSWGCSYYIIANYNGSPYGGPWNAWVK